MNVCASCPSLGPSEGLLWNWSPVTYNGFLLFPVSFSHSFAMPFRVTSQVNYLHPNKYTSQWLLLGEPKPTQGDEAHRAWQRMNNWGLQLLAPLPIGIGCQKTPPPSPPSLVFSPDRNPWSTPWTSRASALHFPWSLASQKSLPWPFPTTDTAMGSLHSGLWEAECYRGNSPMLVGAISQI